MWPADIWSCALSSIGPKPSEDAELAESFPPEGQVPPADDMTMILPNGTALVFNLNPPFVWAAFHTYERASTWADHVWRASLPSYVVRLDTPGEGYLRMDLFAAPGSGGPHFVPRDWVRTYPMPKFSVPLRVLLKEGGLRSHYFATTGA
jgi:hypothetical protein